MATVTKWTPFGVALDLTASGDTVVRKSATQFTVSVHAFWETYYQEAQTDYGMDVTSGGVTKTISPQGNKADHGSGTFTGTYSISGNGAATKTITVTFKNYNTWAGKSASKPLTFNVSVPAWTSYTVSYNKNTSDSVSGMPSSQTKWKDQTLTISSAKPTRTGYSFQGWGLSASTTTVTYKPGSSYTANAGDVLYAIWKANTYPVTYHLNDGTGSFPKQTKTYGVTLKLHGTEPTRENYIFKGWGTTANASTPTYAAGSNYYANSAADLYAIWELAYVKPRISNFKVSRCDSEGNLSDTGTCALVNFHWVCDKTVKSINVAWTYANYGTYSEYFTCEGTTGEISEVLTDSYGPDGIFSTDTTYSFIARVEDENGSSSVSAILPGSIFVLDLLAGGKGAAFGKPAEFEGILDISFQTKLAGGLLYPILEPCDLDEKRTPNMYAGRNVKDYTYTCSGASLPFTTGTFILEVMSGGPDGQTLQRITVCDKVKPQVYERWYYTSSWSDWTGGWLYPTLTDAFVMYGSDTTNNRTRYRKDGRLVEIRGIVSPTADITGNTDMTDIFTLPEAYWPISPIYTLCQGSGTCTWTLRVNTNGKVSFSRYRNGNAFATAYAPTADKEGTWLPFQVTYFAR